VLRHLLIRQTLTFHQNLRKKEMKMPEIWVAGFPSFYGGADVELDHNIDLWTQFSVDVHLVPMFGHDPRMVELCRERGCTVHQYQPDIFRDKLVVSFCNGAFLDRLPEIMEQGRPRRIIWFNCMTWNFDKELTAHKNGWIDEFGFVSEYQRRWLTPKLEEVGGPIRCFEGYRAYFNVDNRSQRIAFEYRPPKDWFAMGRISRDDAQKFSPDLWDLFYKVCSPKPTKSLILGYGPNAHSRCGAPPAGLDWLTWAPGSIPVRDFYERVHCVIHKTGGSRESYCRVVPECYAFGVPVIVEDEYAFPELIIDGVTGFRCKSSAEMSFRASELAFDETRRKKMIFAARDYLEGHMGNKEACWKSWHSVL
jgi:glycosyltransferase involved in cell wall biosynthesis